MQYHNHHAANEITDREKTEKENDQKGTPIGSQVSEMTLARTKAQGLSRSLAVSVCLMAISSGVKAMPGWEKARPVVAQHAMVVSSQHLATQVGINILKQGGNAVDAAVAVGYALAVVHPCCGNVGGGGFMTIHLADGRNLFLNFREKAPVAASHNMYLNQHGGLIPGKSLWSYKAVGIPGTVMGLNEALKRFGTMSRMLVMDPAIHLAQNGYILGRSDVRIMELAYRHCRQHADCDTAFFRNSRGEPYKAGERLTQPILAHTLELVEKGGSRAFYDGLIAKKIVEDSEKRGGILRMKDFRDYTVEWEDPIRCRYHGYMIVSAPPPSSGGTTLCEMLNVLSGYPIAKRPFHSAENVHDLVEAMRFSYADRNTFLGDPDFVHNPVERLLSSRHAAWIRSQIKPRQATSSSKVYGSLKPFEGVDTTQYSIIDDKGNAVSVTYTINSLFGSGIMAPGTGFFLNNEMNDFSVKPGSPNQFGLVQGEANSIAPGKRPLSSMTPTVVLKNGQPFLVTGSPGGSRIITITLETIVNVIDHHMNLQRAVDAPRIHQQWLPSFVQLEPHALSPGVEKKLERMGYHFKTFGPWGAVEAILASSSGGRRILEGANDARRPEGLAAGY